MVENYFQQELNDVCFQIEALDEWTKINQELGLSEQLKFTESAKSPVPYPYINSNMIRVFETLCPTKVALEKYNKTPIPLEVLKQLSFSKNENFFNKYEVWYDDKSPDPLLIGIIAKYYCRIKVDGQEIELKDDKGNTKYFNSELDAQTYCIANDKEFSKVYEYTWGDNFKRYLICRWGDMIRPFSELKNLAKERIVERYSAEIKNTLKDCQLALEKLNENATLYLAGEISESKLKGTSNW